MYCVILGALGSLRGMESENGADNSKPVGYFLSGPPWRVKARYPKTKTKWGLGRVF